VHGCRGIGTRKGLLRALSFGARPFMEVSYVPGANGVELTVNWGDTAVCGLEPSSYRIERHTGKGKRRKR
jgi:hypothetical protein